METLGNTTETDIPLVVDPESLEGVASAYRYKLTLKNESLIGSTFSFNESLDVFSFTAVDKKRALKKEEWPSAGSFEDLNRYDVKVQLMAGNVEIQNCDGCASWKDKTRKPFLILTPTGERCVHFQKQPFLLLIFRCCPKFHSCNKQFRLVLTLTSRSGEVLRNEVNIYRKKMVSSKKRKCTTPPPSGPVKVQSVARPQAKLLPAPPQMKAIRDEHSHMEEGYPFFPMSNTSAAKPMGMPLQYMVSSQIMYDLLYNDGKPQVNSEIYDLPEIRAPVMKRNEVYHQIRAPMIVKKDIKLEEPVLPATMAKHLDSMKEKMPAPFIKFDFYRPLPFPEPAPLYVSLETTNDERWLDSVFSEINGGHHGSKAIDDLSALLDLPDSLPNYEDQF